MKDVLKVFGLVFVGLFIAIFIYPTLHEFGHMLATFVLGGSVKEFHVFPMAYVVCDMSHTRVLSKIIIGLSGMLLPFLLSSIVQPKKFWGWYICFITRGVCILSFVISLAAIVLFHLEREIENEDIIQVLKMEPAYGGIYFAFLMLLLVADIILVVRSRPINQCLRYFELDAKSE